MSSGEITEVVEFSGFRLERGKRRVTGPEGVDVALTPKAFNTLAYLVAHPGEVVDKRTLFDAVWPGVVVEDNNLNQAVSALRRALGDNPQEPRFIATVPGRGFQFVAPVRVVAAADVAPLRVAQTAPRAARGGSPEPMHRLAAVLRRRDGRAWTFGTLAVIVPVLVTALALWRTAAPVAPTKRAPRAESAAATAAAPAAITRTPAGAVAAAGPSLAVLPFRNLSSDPDEELFADGLSEELIARLEQVRGLRVIGRTSSFVYKNHAEDLRAIGEALGVESLLEGSVRNGDGRLRITAELVDASTGFLRWSQTYERPKGDALAIQQNIARAAADALSVALDAADARDPFSGLGPQSPEAYDLYLLAMGLFMAEGREHVLRAAELLRRVVALDPGFVQARFELARTLFLTHSITNDPTALAHAHEVIERAIAEAPREWVAAELRAWRQLTAGDWPGASDSLAAARALAPPSARAELERFEAHLLEDVGRVSETLDVFHARVRNDPLSLGDSYYAQTALDMAGHPADAEAESERSRDLAGDRSGVAAAALWRALGVGDPEGIETALADYMRTGGVRDGDRAVYAARNDRTAALRVLRDQIARAHSVGAMSPIMAATLAAHYDDTALALEGMRTWMRMRPADAFPIWSPALAGVRRDPRFKDFVRDFGFLAYWRETGKWGDFCRPLGKADFECR